MRYLHVSDGYEILPTHSHSTESVRYVLERGSIHLLTVFEVVLDEVGGSVVVVLAADNDATSG